jgi:hypothetical protein
MATEGGATILLLTRNLPQGGFNNYVNSQSLLRRPLKLTTVLYRIGNRDQVYPEIVSANECLGVSFVYIKK